MAVAMSREVGSKFRTGKGFMLMLGWSRIYIDNIVSAMRDGIQRPWN